MRCPHVDWQRACNGKRISGHLERTAEEHKPIELEKISSVSELEELGMALLKSELTRRSLKVA
jgi:hypothetical protein